ncbi:MAG: universal stress protein [Chitinophagales bacterium]|jgi:universal stress protein A|nr:universal stress protein [Sphingobacteriales bacterium]
MTFKNVLCPVDFSDNSSKIIELAVKLSEQHGHIVLFHHSVLISPVQGPDAAVSFEADQELRDMAKKQLDDMAVEFKAKFPTRTFETHHSFLMSMTDEINEVVKEKQIDIIVMGTHGRTGLKRLLMGSIAEDVLRHAACPVFLVKV